MIYKRLHRALVQLKIKRRFLPQSAMGKAIDYALGQWPGLACWLEDAHTNSEWHPLSGTKPWGNPLPVDNGWGVELVIPFSDLGITPPAPGSNIGITIGCRHAWNNARSSLWGGMGWLERDSPRCLARLQF